MNNFTFNYDLRKVHARRWPGERWFERSERRRPEVRDLRAPATAREIQVALLTGGRDRPYAFGLATALMPKGAALDLIGSDELDAAEFHGNPGVNFLNLRGSQRPDVSFPIKYSGCSSAMRRQPGPRSFISYGRTSWRSWDRTLLTLYYRLLGKKIVVTVHNVNAGRRDSKDTRLNRLTLRIQYQLADHVFVHADKMGLELVAEFSGQPALVTVIRSGSTMRSQHAPHPVPRKAKTGHS